MAPRRLTHYFAIYDHEHHHPANKALHGVGIPMIIAGLLLTAFYWKMALGLFAGGWMLLFVGHRIEGNRPAFFQGIVYFLVGPLWVAKEIKDALSRSPRPKETRA